MNDFRSDTFTTPLPEMKAALATCSWGDSVFGEDTSTSEFEQHVATLAGKEAGIFMVSGTMANQIGVRVNLSDPPYSLICDERAHIFTSEAAGIATLSQAMATPVKASNGVHLVLEDIIPRVIPEDQHFAPTRLIALENTLSGTIMPIGEIKRISEFARARGIQMHLDGARLWNASAATGVSIAEYCSYFDTVSLCFSKGLCAPVGSVLIGPSKLVHRARLFRKQVGGGIRQSGWLAACASLALDKVFPAMPAVHAKAAYLGQQLESIGVVMALPVQTCFVVYDAKKSGIDLDKVRELAAQEGLKLWGERLALNYWTSDESVEKLIEVFKRAKQ